MSDTSQAAFAAALAGFQGELPHVGKGSKAQVPTKNGGSYSYDYAALPDILAVALPVLTKHGFAFTASPVMTEHGFVLRFALVHKDGHREEGAYPLPDPAHASPQQIGSAITYGRRYCFCAVTGIAPDEDDDGQAASDARARSHQEPPQRVTDVEWFEDIRRRLVACTRPSEVRGLEGEARVRWAENALSDEDARLLRQEMEQRKAELSGDPQEALV